jgi:ASC-1-like (ASCH) protein
MLSQTHYMKLHPEPFDRIRAGLKTDELRLNDKKRRSIHVGDRIVFSKRPECAEALTVEVVALTPHATFADMYESVKGRYPEITREGFVASMRQYYPEEDEQKYGTLEIGIRLRP